MEQDSVAENAPLNETIEPKYFFSGGRRGDTVEQIIEAVLGGMAFITLVADEGDGKTMICSMVQQELPDNVHCVPLSSRVESFDDIVRGVFRAIEYTFTDEEKELPILEQFQLVKQSLEETDQKILIIFDEAEKLYLATLERARKMLESVNGSHVCIGMLLAGRPLFS